ncbi:hypothetical protein BH09ACT5_BH09ACT5_12620 [soil metagenome]
MTRSWLRRNVLALLVIVGSLGGILFLLLGPQLIARAEDAVWVEVPQGETVESNGYSFTLTLSQEFPGEGLGTGGNSIPRGDALVGAVIVVKVVGEVPGEDETLGCDAELTSRADGRDREWHTVSDESLFAYAIGEDRTAYCILEGEDFELESVFLTPEGVYDGATVDLTVGEDQFRFELAH